MKKVTDKTPQTITVDGKQMQLISLKFEPPDVLLALENRTLRVNFEKEYRLDAKPFQWPPLALEIGDRDAYDRDKTRGWRAVYPNYEWLSPKTDRKQTVTPRYWCKVTVAEFHAKPEKQVNSEKPVKNADKYVFRQNGDSWEIVFEDQVLKPVRHLSGMLYLHKLLSRPGNDIPAQELFGIPPEAVAPSKSNTVDRTVRDKYGIGGSRQYVIDRKEKEMLICNKKELEKENKNLETSQETRDKNETEIARIDKALANCRVAKATGGATFEDKQMKRCRQAVSVAIDSAIKTLSKRSEKLADHLKSVRKGKIFVYTGALTWKTR